LYGSDTPSPHARTPPMVSFGLRPLTLPVEIPVKLVPTLAFETPLYYSRVQQLNLLNTSEHGLSRFTSHWVVLEENYTVSHFPRRIFGLNCNYFVRKFLLRFMLSFRSSVIEALPSLSPLQFPMIL